MKSLALAILALFPLSLSQASSPTPAQQAFEQLKALKGEWKITNDKDADTVTYEVRANGHAVVETMWDMVTVFHLDGDSILMTHYCSAGNQPRTRATDFAKSDRLKFEFVDVSNGKEGGHHIDSLTMEFLGENKIRNTWTAAGAHDEPVVIELERK